MYKLEYFKKSQTFCIDDFKNIQDFDLINLKYLLSLSELKRLETVFSGKFIGKFAVVTMSNNDKYYINENSYNSLLKELEKIFN